MTTQRSLLVAMLTAMLAVPVAASGQTTPPAPKPAPTPQPTPAPRHDPMTIVIPDLSLLQDPTWLRLPEIRFPDITIPDFKMPDLQFLDITPMNEAMAQARLAVDDARLGFQDNMPYRLAINTRGGGDYSTGKDLLSQHKYDEAISHFDRVIAQKAANVDGAQYWKAYAQFKLGKSDDALATLAGLKKEHPQSRYLTDSGVLEADARRMAGQPVNPAAMNDDQLKVLAINGIKNAEPDRAIPLLEDVLKATNSLGVKKQALYVLASMSNQPKAHQILLDYAKGAGNPDLQTEAIRYIASNSDKQSTAAELMQIYQSTQDTDVKLAVIGALRISGDRSALFTIAGSNGSPTVVRSSALGNLAGTLGPQELLSLYEKEPNKDLRLQIVSVLGSMDATDQLNRVIRVEKDQDVIRRVIRSLGNQPSAKTGQFLVDLYGTQQDQDTRKTVIGALANQRNAEGLVAIARKEGNLTLKTEIVRHLSEMAPKSKVAADYLMEIIK